MSTRRGWTIAPDGVERVIELADYDPDRGLPSVAIVEGRAYPFAAHLPGTARWTSWTRVTAGDAVEFPLDGHRARIERRILLPGLTLALRLWWLRLTRGGVGGFLAALDGPGRDAAAHWWLYELRVDDAGMGFLVLTAVGARIPGGRHAHAWWWTAVPPGVAPPAPGAKYIGTWAGRDWEGLAEDLVVHPDAPAGADGAGNSATSDGTGAPAPNTLRDTASPNVTRRRG